MKRYASKRVYFWTTAAGYSSAAVGIHRRLASFTEMLFDDAGDTGYRTNGTISRQRCGKIML